ncbi:hypothetical protein F4778DRAFT_464596 [Xylariomycetidae sp. FL2044]|nr:hypothetical protein F4778DRAFT_464596 [Xylariomycetidae sp. FL2044]
MENPFPQPDTPGSRPTEAPRSGRRPAPGPTRQCRICMEDVAPTYEGEEPGYLDGIRNKQPKKEYISEEGGRLICPCQCSGSVKYVHEECLRLWMLASPDPWTCPSCKFKYQPQRLAWARRLQSPFLSLVLTVAILLVTVFLLGFVADPILSLWLDPVGTITDTVSSSSSIYEDEYFDVDFDPDEGWLEHFLKGIFSLGLLGFVKAIFAMSPWQWWNLRTSGVVGGGGVGRRGGTGRQRMENINIILVVIGVFTFLYAVWKGTRRWTEMALDLARVKILNVQKDDDDDGGGAATPEANVQQDPNGHEDQGDADMDPPPEDLEGPESRKDK